MKNTLILTTLIIFSLSACSAPKPPAVDGSNRVPVNTSPINPNLSTVL